MLGTRPYNKLFKTKPVLEKKYSCALSRREEDAPMANIDEIAKAFVGHYYQQFDSNRSALGGLYVRITCLTLLYFLRFVARSINAHLRR